MSGIRHLPNRCPWWIRQTPRLKPPEAFKSLLMRRFALASQSGTNWNQTCVTTACRSKFIASGAERQTFGFELEDSCGSLRWP